MNESEGGYQELTGFTYVKGNRELGGHADVTQWAKSAFWTPILAKLGLSWDDVEAASGGSGGGGLTINGSNEDFELFQNWVEQGSGGAYTAYRDANNRVTLLKIPHKEHVRLNDKQRAFIDIMLDATDESKNLVTIGLVNNSELVFIDEYTLNLIDVGDISNIPAAFNLSRAGILAHAVYEQTLKQRAGDTDNRQQSLAHKLAIEFAEDPVNGSKRSDNRDLTTLKDSGKVIKDVKLANGRLADFFLQSGQAAYNYKAVNLTMTVVLTVVNNNITGSQLIFK